MNTDQRTVVFTAVEDAVLDRATRSFERAAEALDLLRGEGIPLILCSSRTRAELELFQQDLRIRAPFVCEDGGAIFIPRKYFSFPLSEAVAVGGYQVIELSAPYAELAEALRQAARREQVPVVGFDELSVDAVATEHKISLLEARLAKLRDYSEPFRILDPDPAARTRLFHRLQRGGFRCTPHGRFYHLTGNKDERQPFRKLKSLYRKAWGELRTVGIGVRLAHLAFLREADFPVVLPAGCQEETARLLGELPAARLAGKAGPPGWNEVIVELAGRRTLQAVARSLEG